MTHRHPRHIRYQAPAIDMVNDTSANLICMHAPAKKKRKKISHDVIRQRFVESVPEYTRYEPAAFHLAEPSAAKLCVEADWLLSENRAFWLPVQNITAVPCMNAIIIVIRVQDWHSYLTTHLHITEGSLQMVKSKAALDRSSPIPINLQCLAVQSHVESTAIYIQLYKLGNLK